MDPARLALARSAPGFMPDEEGLALVEAAHGAPPGHPWVEVGTYCGKSTIYLGSAAEERGVVLFTVDHHRGSEENQPGQLYHDPRLVDVEGRVDTLPTFRAILAGARLEDTVVAVVGRSEVVATHWSTPIALLFLDGGHSQRQADLDFDGWARHLVVGGLLLIHDVFPDPRDGGRPPYEVYCRALRSRTFEEVGATGSLRVLRRRPHAGG